MGSLFPQRYFSPNQQRSFGRTGYICKLCCVPLRTYLLKSESSSLYQETRPPAINPTIEKKSWHILWQAIMDKSAREFFIESRFFSQVENFFLSRNFFMESRIISSSRILTTIVEDFILESRFFFLSRKLFHRVENTRHAVLSFAAKTIKRYGSLQICWLRSLFIHCCRSSS